MKPILYASSETSFVSQGLGVLWDCISCYVTETRNGTYELQMTYPVDGIHFGDLLVASIIMAKPNFYSDPQPFVVYRISKPLNGRVSIYAEHISYRMSQIPVKPCSSTTIAGALSALRSATVGTNPFTFWTDKDTTANFSIKEPRSLRAALGGQEGSILDVYGGEFEFDRYTVKVHNHRGEDRGVTIRYGKNLTDLVQEENIANTVTGILPFWVNPEDPDDIQYVNGDVVSAGNAGLFPYSRVVPVDFSSEFNSKPSSAQLKARAESYISTNEVGVPKVSLKVSFAALWQSEEYKNLIGIEQVRLCDTVTIEYEKLGVSAQAKVIKTTYDVLLERYTTIELGDARSDFSSTIRKVQEQAVAQADAASSTAIEAAINHATQLITGGLGGHVVLVRDANGEPQEIVILGDTDDITTAQDVWRWNRNGLGHSSTGYTGTFSTAITADGHIVADFVDTGNINASLITTGALNATLITAGYMLADRIRGGTLTLGGYNNVNGLLEVYDSNNVLKGKWNNDGAFYFGNYKETSGSTTNQATRIYEGGVLNTSPSGKRGAYLGGGHFESGEMDWPFWDPDGFDPSYLGNEGKWTSIYAGGASFENEFGRYLIFQNSDTLEIRAAASNRGVIKGRGDIWIQASDEYDTDYDPAYLIAFYIRSTRRAYINKDGLTVSGAFTASGTKSRVVDTDQYAERLLYCYETASPMFGDVGEGIIGEDGQCYVSIDPIFARTVSLNQYQVFLQKYGAGECYVSERKGNYFVVSGTEGLRFGWEIKAKQSDFDQLRLEKNEDRLVAKNELNYGSEAIKHIMEIQEGRVSA